ncbi:winged helix-turn-helix transcriptional regulator [Niameybacter massiliensis]|uniref:Winged helix-turn-helix transcriptional regulator n=1 Tax=Holtiella tumoricola TaxID=3018743 RepID=A0AA42DNL6_9FIRM|nr:winged helix-turn-helix transcriptional regulator [Holtiella tumoricola]MDA3732132.1 winged helix-turn-helix transcriptional regulator [Holtiella tumoricola]
MIQYVTMPIEILSLENLNLQEKFILSLARSFENGCFLSNAQIAQLIGISKGRVSAIISKLVKENYLDISLRYKTNSKEVERRTITFKQMAQKVIETVKKCKEKAKQIKSDYITQKTKVGTETVQQVAFGSNFYNKRKQNKFTTTYSHNWDIDELERLEMQRLEEQYE